MLYLHLSPDAQERARDWYRENVQADDNFWSECVLGDWKEKLALKGFEDADIRYSGFCCQGDGASFTAGVKRDYPLPPGFVQRIAEMNLVAMAMERFNQESSDREVAFELQYAKIERSVHSHYVHANTIDAEIAWELTWRGSVSELWTKLEEDIGIWIRGHEKALTEEARDLSNEIYDDLEAAYDDSRSDEMIAETLVSLDYHFDGDGNQCDPPEELKAAA